jgi:ferritin-like metal-binding protein YciE
VSTMNSQTKLRELFVEGLNDAFFAEKLILRTLKEMARGAVSPEFRAAIEAHLADTQKHLHRLLRIFDDIEWPHQIDNPARGETYDAIVGAVDDMRLTIGGWMDPQALDAAFATCAQAVEHYEVARYGLLKSWAQQLGLTYAAQLLNDTLEEEMRAEKLFGQLAAVNLERNLSQAA